MSKIFAISGFAFVLFASISQLYAHGEPIIVNTLNGTITTDKSFYANTTDENAIEGSLKYSSVSGMFTNNLPGFDIVDNNLVGQLLELNLLPMSSDGTSANARYLWHWNLAQGVTLAPPGTELRIDSTRAYPAFPDFGTITGGQNFIDPGSLSIYSIAASDIGFHRHLLQYYLTPTVGLQQGVFGIYAELKTTSTEKSDPFWIFFNTVEDFNQVTAGANAIMAAAQPIAVPEPGTIALLAIGIVLGTGRFFWKKAQA